MCFNTSPESVAALLKPMSVDVSAWLKIAATTEIRPEQLTALLEEFGDANSLVTGKPAALAATGLGETAIHRLRSGNEADVEATEAWLSQPATHLVTWDDERYPPLLKTLPDAPALLYVHGDPDSLRFPLIAMVGSRNPTRGGEMTARDFAIELSQGGFGIASGLALGIDTAAHAGALHADGLTIAVLGTGIDRIYPAANLKLAHAIAASGAIVSEFPLGTVPRRHNFPRRNRLISGLCLGTLVVEAAERSGSLITARLAAEQGREVFAIPGSIHNPMARGCHRLIRDGARLVETTDDIFAELGALTDLFGTGDTVNTADNQASGDSPAKGTDGEYATLLEALGWEPCTTNTLRERSGLTIAEVSSMLLILELEGVVEALPGGRYSRLKQARQIT